MENNKVWKGVKISIIVLLLITVLGTLGGLLYKSLKPVEDVPTVENRVAFGEAVYSMGKIEIINADLSKTAVDSLSFDNIKENYVIDESGQKVCRFIVTFDDYINIMDTDLSLSVVLGAVASTSEDISLFTGSSAKYVFDNKLGIQLYDKSSFKNVSDYWFDSLSFFAIPRGYVQHGAESQGMSYFEYVEFLIEQVGENMFWAKDLQDNQLYCEFEFKNYVGYPYWNISFDSFVMSGVKSVEVVNE